MICYFVSERYQHTMRKYLASSWGKALRDRITITPYERLVWRGRVPAAGVYIFSDIERLSPARYAAAMRVRQRLEESGASVALLNHPQRTMRRHALLRMLQAEGVNSFAVHRLTDAPLDKMRYPVFLRQENDHNGALTPLLHGEDQIRRAAAALQRRGVPLGQLLAIEFCDTAGDDGLYRKYAAFVIRGTVIPRHLWYGRSWMLKRREVWDERLAAEQRAFLEENPHASVLRDVCAKAGVDYGRVDYSVRRGKVQVWEINTNPVIMRDGYSDRNADAHALCARRLQEAFETLDDDEAGIAEPLSVAFERGAWFATQREGLAAALARRRYRWMCRVLPRASVLSEHGR